MIRNQREYAITKARIERLDHSLRSLEDSPPDPGRVHPRLLLAEKDALRQLRSELVATVHEYDELVTHPPRRIAVHSLEELPSALIQARLARRWTQKELGERLGLKEQQIQRYEATGYASASLSRILTVAGALGLTATPEVSVEPQNEGLTKVLSRLRSIGFERSFIESRVTSDTSGEAKQPVAGEPSGKRAMQLADRVARIVGVSRSELLNREGFAIDMSRVGLVGFRLPKGRSTLKTTAYLTYAHYISFLASKATVVPTFKVESLSGDRVRDALARGRVDGALSRVVSHLWDSGVVVLPLDDPGAFNAAALRVGPNPTIILKQPIRSEARWLFDLLHEVHHLASQPIKAGQIIVDLLNEPVGTAGLVAEEQANQFAGDLLLSGKAETLAKESVERANHALQRLKTAVVEVASRNQVSVASLANYMAYRLAFQGENWWGTANNLQAGGSDPYVESRDAFLVRANLSRLDDVERELLTLALRSRQNVP